MTFVKIVLVNNRGWIKANKMADKNVVVSLINRPNWLTRCCIQFKSPGVKIS